MRTDTDSTAEPKMELIMNVRYGDQSEIIVEVEDHDERLSGMWAAQMAPVIGTMIYGAVIRLAEEDK